MIPKGKLEVLVQCFEEGIGRGQTAQQCGISKPTVARYWTLWETWRTGQVYVPKIGRPKTRRDLKIKCKECGVRFAGFEYPSRVTKKPRYRSRYCSRNCMRRYTQKQRRIFRGSEADIREYLYSKYWVEEMSTLSIAALHKTDHHVVRTWMVRLQIPRRAVGRTSTTSCKMARCLEPIFKLRHPVNGSFYGTTCRDHRVQHRQFLYKAYRKSKKESRGSDLMAEIANSLPPTLPPTLVDEIQGELILAVLEGNIVRPLTREIVKTFISSAFREYADKFRFISLDAPAGPDNEDGAYTHGRRLGIY